MKIKHAFVTCWGITHDEDFHLLIVLHMHRQPCSCLCFGTTMLFLRLNTYMLKVSCNTISDYHNRNITIYLKAHLDNLKGLSHEMDSVFDCMHGQF